MQLTLFNKKNINEKSTDDYFSHLVKLLGVDTTPSGWTDIFGENLEKFLQKKISKPINTLSLFTGGGGLDIAFHSAGFNITDMVEIEKRYVETLKKNSEKGGIYQNAQIHCVDIRDWTPPSKYKVDFVIGGPPCQTFSAAGRRAAGVDGISDPRGSLFKEYVRILKKLKPKGFLFENVYGIIGAQGGKAWNEITKSFSQAGYTISYRILDAADYGVPQNRERLFIIGTKKSEFCFPKPTHGPDSLSKRKYYTSGDAISDLDDKKLGSVGGRYGHLLNDIPPGLNYSFYTKELGHPNPVFSWRSKFSDFLYKGDPNMPVRTLKAQGGQFTGPFHWNNRPFSLHELMRLQTFPLNYTVVGNKQSCIEQLGNSVPPQLARILALAILDQVFNIDFPFSIDYLSPSEKLNFRSRKRELTHLYKEKSTHAINNMKAKKSKKSKDYTSLCYLNTKNLNKYTASIDDKFTWTIKNGSTSNEILWNVGIKETISHGTYKLFAFEPMEKNSLPKIVVDIKPLEEWGLPFEKAQLSIQSFSKALFTGAWKAFEYHISSNNFKADLVQLNAYYQYLPKLMVDIERYSLRKNSAYYTEWKVVKNVLQGIGVRQIFHMHDLSKMWDCNPEQILDCLIMLKSLGYEVRNKNTNSQIPDNYVLIPYVFPTLTPMSVQLRKNLVPA